MLNTETISSTYRSRILFAETDPSMLELLPSKVNQKMSHVGFDLCSSRDHAEQHLLASTYKLILSSLHLLKLDDFRLLKRNQAYQPSVPLVVIAQPADKTLAREALERGVFDVIANPLNMPQTIASIRLALWQNRLLSMIAVEEKARETYRQFMEAYPNVQKTDGSFSKSLLSLDKTIACSEKTIQRVEESIQLLSKLAKDVETQARDRAFELLDVFAN